MFDNSSHLNPWEAEIVAKFWYNADKVLKP